MNKKGFTLIELLIVVLILSILGGATLGVINTSGIREKTRDSQRKADLKKIQTALELYYTDKRTYPPAGLWVTSQNSNFTSPLVAGGYISALPVDPAGFTSTFDCNPTFSEFGYSYKTSNDFCPSGNCPTPKYVLVASMEVGSSASDSTCSTLSNWESISGCPFAGAESNCYGVQNP